MSHRSLGPPTPKDFYLDQDADYSQLQASILVDF